MSDEQLDTESEERSAGEDSDNESLAGVGDEDGAGAGKRTLGVERWVQLGYFSAAMIFIWLFSHIMSTVWYFFADPDEVVVSAVSVLTGIATTIILYRHRPTHALATEIADELSKVTWPTRKETSSSTVVVIVTSIIAAAMLGVFDAVWSAVTDLVYKV
jgi:preprotein translocase subunit SecE